MNWNVAIALFVVVGVLWTSAGKGQEKVELTCELAFELQERAEARRIFIVGEIEAAQEFAEKVTLSAEINGLRELFFVMQSWSNENCREV